MCKLSIIFLLTGCYYNPCGNTNIVHQSDYNVIPDSVTKKGIKVDTSGHNIDLDRVDWIVDQVEECLYTIDQSLYSCSYHKFNLPILREHITVKIPKDWHWSQDGTQQLLWDEAPQSGCIEKGLTDPGECYWRATVQDFCTAVVTPNLHMLADPIIKIVTGCREFWYTPELSKCFVSGNF